MNPRQRRPEVRLRGLAREHLRGVAAPVARWSVVPWGVRRRVETRRWNCGKSAFADCTPGLPRVGRAPDLSTLQSRRPTL